MLSFRLGYSPLYYATKTKYSYCAKMLLDKGADITARSNKGVSPLYMIVRNVPNVLAEFEDMLDKAITSDSHDINDWDHELKLNFSILVPKDSKGEISMFTNFIEVDLRHILRHPLCESFIYFKWLKIRKFFFASLMFQLLFTVLHSTFVLIIYSSSQCVIRNNCKFKVCYYCLTLL